MAGKRFVIEIDTIEYWTPENVGTWFRINTAQFAVVSVQAGTIQDIVDEAQDNARRAVGIDDGGLV